MGLVFGRSRGSVVINPAKPESRSKREKPTPKEKEKERYYTAHAGLRVTTSNKPALVSSNTERPKDERVLQIKSVDLNVAENVKPHVTFFYEITEDSTEGDAVVPAKLVVRRGKKFDITVRFDKPFDQAKDDLKIIFQIGNKPQINKGTLVPIVLSADDLPNQWGAKIKSQNERDVEITIFTPSNCIVGKWTLKINYIGSLSDWRQEYVYTHPDPIYMIFNPWCPDDQVYMDDESFRLEYVLNDYGKIYNGNSKQISSKPWNFGQFEDFMLDCVFYLLDKAEVPYRSRSDPVKLVRKLTAVCNSPDDDGVLCGNWSGNYAGGKSPTSWVGSVRILEQFWKTKRPVKYGQCWVFSGVLTSLCRCLGIPARSVTNFASAHDTDASVTIDMYWSADGKPIHDMSDDSVWNFHVWNDVWMARPDLPHGYGGWQAIDATPQETSDGVYVTGPMSVNAIRDGNIHLPYDGPFIFAEVNADRIHFIRTEDGKWRKIVQGNAIGKHISTKLPDGFTRRLSAVDELPDSDIERQDITKQYKHAEGTSKEREAVLKAYSNVVEDEGTPDTQADVNFNFADKPDIMVGRDFAVELKMENTSAEARTISATLSCTVVKYTGLPVASIKSQSSTIVMQPHTSDVTKMDIATLDYVDKLVEQAAMKISCVATVKETGQTYADDDDFRLKRPDIDIEVKGKAEAKKPVDVVVSFTNPLQKKLTKCEFEIEAPSLQRPLEKIVKDIVPGGKAEVTFTITPRRRGRKMIVASFDCLELPDISGSTILEVADTMFS